MSRFDSLPSVRRPAYTGPNRCWPCTFGNLLILLAVCLLLAVVVPPLAVVLGLIGVVLIWARGYLVPYTPRLTAVALERLPWGPTHRPKPEAGSLAGDADGEVVLAALVDAGVLEATPETVAPTDEFRRRWRAEMETLRKLDDDALESAALETSPVAEAVRTVIDRDRRYLVLSDGTDTPTAESWLRRPNAIAQVGAVRAMAAFGVPESQRAAGAAPLELFLRRCPACEGPLEEGIAGGCCGPPQTMADGTPKTALTCERCRVQLHVFAPS